MIYLMSATIFFLYLIIFVGPYLLFYQIIGNHSLYHPVIQEGLQYIYQITENMQNNINLRLNIFGSQQILPCKSDFKMESLQDFLTISDIIYGDNEIMAQVVQIKRPFSELKEKFIEAE